MEHAKNFANLAENFSAKFPDLDKFFLCIHILGYISGIYKGLYFSSSGSTWNVSNIVFNKDTIQKIEESFPFSIEQLSEKEKKDLCKYYLEICLQFERRIEESPDNLGKFASNLLSANETQVKSKDPSDIHFSSGSVSFAWSELSAKSQKKYLEWEIERYFYYKTPFVPKQVTETIAALASPKNRQTVYDPNCGSGSIFVEFYNKFPDLNFNFNGVVGNQCEWLFCFINFYVNGILDDKRITVEIEVSSPLEETPKWYYETKSEDNYSSREFADIAVSIVPVKGEITDGELDSRFFGLSYSLKKQEYAYIELMLNATRDSGKTIAIVPDSTLYSSEGRFFREAYLSRDWIESVISLPDNSFNQDAFSEASIVVFNKNKTEKGIVVFDGEDSEFERTEVAAALIISEKDANLRVTRYASKKIKDIKSAVDKIKKRLYGGKRKEIKNIQNIIERYRKERTGKPIASSSKGIELQQYFDNLAETFSVQFPTIKNTVYLYLLVAVMLILDKGNQWLLARESFLINSRIYKEIESFIYEDYYKQTVDIVLHDLVNRDLFSVIKTEDLIITEYGIVEESPFKDAFTEVCKHLISKCLQIESQVEIRNVENLWKEIAKREPKAIQLKRNGSTIKISELSDSAYQELSEGFIAQSFYYEENYLQRFDKLDGILAKTANPKPEQSIFNPNCGIGSIFIELQKQFPNHELRFTGRVDDSFFHILCEANLLAHNVKAFINQEEILDSDIELTFWGDAPDITIGISPIKIEWLGKRDAKFFKLSHKRKKAEYSFIELMINCLGENGKAVVVVPEEFLYRWNAKGFKKAYLKNDWIESVISLPEDTFKEYGSVKASIVVFNKNKAEKGFVTFKSENGQFEETKVRLEEISSLDRLDLRASRYVLKEAKELKNILANTPYPVIRIRDIVQDSISGANYSPSTRIDENSVDDLPYVRVSNLARNETQFNLDISKVERKISREKASRKTVVDYSAVLVSKIAPKLKPTYFKFTGQPIVIGSDVIALKMKEDIDIKVEYFLTQLHSRLVQIQVEMMSSGATINRISTEDFLNIQILLPSLEEQQRQILEMRGVIEEKAIAQERVAKAEEQTDAIEYQVIANMNHSLKNKLGVIINDYDTLVRFLQRKERANSAVSFNDTIRPVFEGENVADVDTIRLITERLKNNLLDTSKVFNTSLKLQTRELKKTSVEIVNYFRHELKPLYAGQNFMIEIVAEPRLKLNALIDKEVFKDAIDNLVNNAKSHGFVEEEREYKIAFELSKSGEVYDEENETVVNYARIVYKNDGKPFPKGFSFNDYVRYSSKAGKTQGTGIGGAVIDKIIKMHDGKFNELMTDENSLFSVQFEILLPLDE